MPKYWGGNYFTHGSFPEVGQRQKTERKKEEEKKRRQAGLSRATLKIDC